MADVVDLHAFRAGRGHSQKATLDSASRDTIVIERLPTGELAYELSGVFTTSRRLSAVVMTKVLARVLED